MSDLSKLDTLLYKTHIKVLLLLRYQRFDMSRSIISLSKIAYQMWCDHSFGQRNKTTERAMGGGWQWQGGQTKFKKVGVVNIGRSS